MKQLDYLRMIESQLEELRESLSEIDEEYARDEEGFPSEIGRIELAASSFAIIEVVDFLRLRAPSTTIDRLRAALLQLVLVLLRHEGLGHGRPLDFSGAAGASR